MAEDSSPLGPEEVREIKTQYNRAKDVLAKINDLYVAFELAQTKFNLKKDEIEKISNDARERFGTIENAKNEAAVLVADIKSNLEKVQVSISVIDDGLRKFENIRGKIEGKDGEIENLVSATNGLRTDIENAKATALNHLKEIEAVLSRAKENITSMQEAYESFLVIRGKITDDKGGLEAILNQTKDLQKKSNDVFSEIKSFHENSKKYLEQIEANKNLSDELREKIGQALSGAETDRSEVSKITQLIADTGLADAFRKRERMLRITSGIWLAILLVSIGALAWMLYSFFGNLNLANIPELRVIIFRFVLTSPLLFLIGLATAEYGKERALNEKYAFKATVAAVMRSHSQFLIELSKDAGQENSDFMRTTIGSLYHELDSKDAHTKEETASKSAAEKDSDNKMKSTDFVARVKELKELVPEPGLLKDIVDLFLKWK
jgi:predicted  nucleic acid-binding Zn-ribbon protein